MHDKKIMWAFFREFGGSLLIYSLILVCAIVYGQQMPDSLVRTVVLVSPMIGICLSIWAMARHLGRIDEYQRQVTLETYAISAALVGGISFTYGFLETAGFPKLSMFTIWPLMAAMWGVIGMVRAFTHR
jgi:hypothetical protein